MNCKDRKGETALFHAVERGHINVVEMLLDCEADIEARYLIFLSKLEANRLKKTTLGL